MGPIFYFFDDRYFFHGDVAVWTTFFFTTVIFFRSLPVAAVLVAVASLIYLCIDRPDDMEPRCEEIQGPGYVMFLTLP